MHPKVAAIVAVVAIESKLLLSIESNPLMVLLLLKHHLLLLLLLLLEELLLLLGQKLLLELLLFELLETGSCPIFPVVHSP